ncbi:alpha/beta fold hydrolase [Methylocella sp.]|uniref:alpha/beta fold hydrolase n=1 Tax=Methylocella sp. TaxID=1978226 RepID=UPI0035B4BE47
MARKISYKQAVNEALDLEMARDPNVILMGGLVSRQMIDDLLKYKRLDGVGEALAAISSAAFAGGRQSAVMTKEAQAIGKPVTVIWGASDKVIPASHAAPPPAGWTAQVIEGAGHMVQMEKAAAVNAIIKKSLGA